MRLRGALDHLCGRRRPARRARIRDIAARERTEREFAEADAFEEQWRKENQDEYHRERLP